MKKIEYIGDDPRQKKALQTINENFEEIFFKRMRILDSDPTDNLAEGIYYYNRKLKKIRLLTNVNPPQWRSI